MQSDPYRSLSLRARVVLDALLHYAGAFVDDDAGGKVMQCWPSRSTIAAFVGRKEAFVDRGLAELRKTGWVLSVNRGGRPGKRNHYHLFVPSDVLAERLGVADDAEKQAHPCGVQGHNSEVLNQSVLEHSLEPDPKNQVQITTTTEKASPVEAVGAGSRLGGGGYSSAGEKAERDDITAKLRAAGVHATGKVLAAFAREQFRADQVDPVIAYVERAKGGPGLIVDLLTESTTPDEVADKIADPRSRPVPTDDWAKRMKAESEAKDAIEAERQAIDDCVYDAMIAAAEKISTLGEGDKADRVRKNIDRIKRVIAPGTPGGPMNIAAALIPAERVELLAAAEPWSAFVVLGNIAVRRELASGTPAGRAEAVAVAGGVA